MISIKLYSATGQFFGTRDYPYSEDIKDATGKAILYPDRMLYSPLMEQVISKDFYLRNDGVAVESRFEEKRELYLKINNIFAQKSEVVQAIEIRISELKIAAIKAKFAYETVTNGTEAEQLFTTLVMIGTLNNFVVSRVVNLILGFTKEQWKLAIRNFLEDLEREWTALNIKLNTVTGQYTALDTDTTVLDGKKKIKNIATTTQNAVTNRNYLIAALLVVVALFIRKKLKKRK